jgi:Ca-activated chloride channel family protein
MLELTYPLALLALPLPLLMRLLPAYRESRDSVRVPFFDKLLALTEQDPQTGSAILRRDRAQRFLVGFMWLCLVIAMAKPQWVSEPIEEKKSGRDLMVAVDLSGSMATRDFTLPGTGAVNRLDAVRHVLRELAAQRASDRLGLIVFGSAPYLQTPFTDDHAIWSALLDETDIGMAGQSTVFGDAIGLSIKLFRESDSDNRVLIILTDGNDTGSKVPPLDAARVAAANGIRIYLIAIGDPASVGEEALDLATIERVAQLTGGAHFQALDRTALAQAYATIARLEPELYETIRYQTRQSLHWLPPALALLLYTLYHLGRMWRPARRTQPTVNPDAA